ncbi:MAG: hypothetical protein LBS97_02030 [Treponema sp.]|jgi:hypothetical protein|nr:hypothetical protein [Treponema sp.]
MKQFTVILLFVLAFLTLSVSVRPSVDGRALVADEGILPSGLYAKATGFFSNEGISVTNPSTGDKVDVLVVGTLDPQDGVAILLSPEAAARLFIAKDSNILVSITKSSVSKEALPELPRESPLKITR